MPSDTSIEARRGRRYGAAVVEFFGALRQAHTYDPLRNPYAVFGLLWGLPIPFFSIGIDLWASGRAFTLDCVREHPIHLFFMLHPLLFAVVFGAMGTVRHRKDGQITRLMGQLEVHVAELAQAYEKLKELDHLKAEFLANVTHELKTPLVAIRGYNEAILEGRFGALTDKQREGLEVAVRNVDRLQKLIEEMLEFERFEAGGSKLRTSDFDLVPLVQSTLDTFKPQLTERRISVELRLPIRLPVRADRDKVGRVLLNLVSNAVKFSPDGSPVGVSATVDADGRRAFITVWDRGPGIPTAAQKYLFTRFWQADGSSRRRHGGTGLGLAICKEIMDAHGEPIRVISSEERGTMVHFELPTAEEFAHGGNPAGHETAHSGR